jgi:hypothetical protein
MNDSGEITTRGELAEFHEIDTLKGSVAQSAEIRHIRVNGVEVEAKGVDPLRGDLEPCCLSVTLELVV